ncbi:cellulose biosynthesis protein BcsQ [Sinimarinibacterium sp. NLF-5-8]|uniref:cellulose biosynthesis protein BcsQ n=1 Tax=Sinimarinibacterium sp. NLF-5-8 TaxID=2698684 RepID=UPI00137C24BE|nr:cellulose biosynthesis protein BcsQ [Sinimarinibacterium sp. NLF-5-8]QHS08824.1 cellulose synthase operon protein YhjQ [Sinimarinibacterium sp. NLF-5-8]
MSMIVVQGLRGGVGCTSVSAGLAYALQQLGQRVLVIDACIDNLLRLHFNLALSESGGWARQVLAGQRWSSLLWHINDQLVLLPHGEIARSDLSTLEHALHQHRSRWARMLATAAATFDWVVIDTPRHGVLSQELAALADLHLCLLEAEPVSHLQLQRDARAQPHYLLNRYNPAQALQRDLHWLWIRQDTLRLAPVKIHAGAAFPEALASKMPVGHYAPDSQAAVDMTALATWCLSQRATPP